MSDPRLVEAIRLLRRLNSMSDNQRTSVLAKHYAYRATNLLIEIDKGETCKPTA